MHLPTPRGPVSGAVTSALAGRPRDDGGRGLDRLVTALDDCDPMSDDVQLALWVMYELHYRGFDGVDGHWEWDPGLLRVRQAVEARFEQALRRRTADLLETEGDADDLAERIMRMLRRVDGPSLAHYVQRDASHDQVLELLVQRSVYHLKESDPASWVIARLDGVPKARLVELQYDEYGAGRPERLHATLFARGLEEAGLRSDYGAYVDVVPGHTLAVSNAMSLFGLHRRLRGAALGHLAAFEATSSLPCRRYAMGLRRLGMSEAMAHYFDEHVEADAVHEQIALRDICGRLVEEDPALLDDVLFGAAVCGALEADAAARTLASWDAGRSSLLDATAGAVA